MESSEASEEEEIEVLTMLAKSIQLDAGKIEQLELKQKTAHQLSQKRRRARAVGKQAILGKNARRTPCQQLSREMGTALSSCSSS